MGDAQRLTSRAWQSGGVFELVSSAPPAVSDHPIGGWVMFAIYAGTFLVLLAVAIAATRMVDRRKSGEKRAEYIPFEEREKQRQAKRG